LEKAQNEETTIPFNSCDTMALVIALANARRMFHSAIQIGLLQRIHVCRYDFIVVAKPDNATTSSSLTAVDIEFANLMARVQHEDR